MRRWLIITITIFTGCDANNVDHPNDIAGVRDVDQEYASIQWESWAYSVNQELLVLEHNYYDLQTGMEVLNTIPINKEKESEYLSTIIEKLIEIGVDWKKFYTLKYKIDQSILSLWELTGHCLYVDIPSEQLVTNIPTIINRYREFIEMNKHLSEEEVILEGLNKTFDAIDSEYFWPALYVLQGKIQFINSVSIILHSAGPDIYRVTPQIQRKTSYTMKKWLENNKKNFQWDPLKMEFRQGGGGGIFFKLPPSVSEDLWDAVTDSFMDPNVITTDR